MTISAIIAEELVSEGEFKREVSLYGEQAGIPVEGQTFIDGLRTQLQAAAKRSNDGFLDNEYLRIENVMPVLKRLQRKAERRFISSLNSSSTERIADVEIVDALSDTEH